MTVCLDRLNRFSVDKTHISCREIDQRGEKERGRTKREKGTVCASLFFREGDRAVGDAFRGRIRTAGVHKEVDRPYT